MKSLALITDAYILGERLSDIFSDKYPFACCCIPLLVLDGYWAKNQNHINSLPTAWYKTTEGGDVMTGSTVYM